MISLNFLIQTTSSYDFVVILIVSIHLLFSISSAAYLLHFHLHSSPLSSSLSRRLRLNSLLPVRFLLVLYASTLSLSELLRLPLRRSYLCTAYYLFSQSFSQPAFFATLLFLLRASTQSKPTSSSPSLFTSSLIHSFSSSLPFAILHSIFLSLPHQTLEKLPFPLYFFTNSFPRCAHPLFGTLLQAIFGAIYIPLFIFACSNAVCIVINRKLRVRLYGLAIVVAMGLATQVLTLALSSLWDPTSNVSQGLETGGFVAVMVCVFVGEVILVVQPISDAVTIVRPERKTTCDV